MALGFIASVRNNMLDEIVALIDAGSAAGVLKIYDGTRPATGGAIGGSTLLAELPLSDPSFPASTGGVITANAITDDTSANATGTASWFRLEDSDGNAIIDGDVGVAGSDLNLATTSIASGVTVSITSMVLTAGNA